MNLIGMGEYFSYENWYLLYIEKISISEEEEEEDMTPNKQKTRIVD